MAMDMKQLEEKVKDIIVEELGVERDKLTNDASFMEDLGADSLDTVELVMAFEKEFDIDIPDEEAEKLRTVGQALQYLHEKMGKKRDRKSTRLNSSHGYISYAVFCLKKKNNYIVRIMFDISSKIIITFYDLN